jgi:hypothetical protein
MARSIDTIQQQIIDAKNGTPELSGLTSDSRRSSWLLWTRIVATIIAFFEQLNDVFKTEIEGIVAVGAPSTPLWIQDRVFKFQYDATNPQVLAIIDLVPQYEVINPDLRIVTRCSVKTNYSNQVNVKVAKSTTPEPLTPTELASLQGYLTMIGTAGINYQAISSDSDKLMVNASIYYNGQYTAIINDSVKTAITNYLSSIPFDGQVIVSDLEGAIKAVAGVNDVVLNEVYARANITGYVDATKLVTASQLLLRKWDTIAGYIVPETESTHTLDDTLTYIAQ